MVGVVLLLACASVANLLIAKSSTRQQEIAVRLSLGAGRARVLRQLITENLLLGVTAATVALFLAHWTTPLLVRMLTPSNNPATLDTRIDIRLLLFSAALCITTVLFCGVLSALRFSRTEIYSALKGGGRLFPGGRIRSRRILVTAQIALSLLLVVSAVLFTRSFLNLTSQYLGFDPQRVLVARLGYEGSVDKQTGAGWAKLLRQVRALPGVEAASVSSASLFSGNPNTMGVRTAAGATNPPDPLTGILFISTDYFRTMGIRLISGRDLEPSDNDASPRSVVIVNEAFRRNSSEAQIRSVRSLPN